MYNIRLTRSSTSMKQLIFSPDPNMTATEHQNVSRVISGNTKDAIWFMPNFVMSYPLKRGEMIAWEDNNSIVVLRWRDVHNVRILSTKNIPIMTPNSDSTRHGHPQKI